MASWYLDDTETLLKHRVNFRKALEELHDPEFPDIHLKKKALLRQSLECIEHELKKRGENAAPKTERRHRAFAYHGNHLLVFYALGADAAWRSRARTASSSSSESPTGDEPHEPQKTMGRADRIQRGSLPRPAVPPPG